MVPASHRAGCCRPSAGPGRQDWACSRRDAGLAQVRVPHHPSLLGLCWDGDIRIPWQGSPWDFAGSIQVLLGTTATASPGMLEGPSLLISCHSPQQCLLQPMASRASSIPAQQQSDLGTGTRDTGSQQHIRSLYCHSGHGPDPGLRAGLWVQPLDPSNTVEKMNHEPPPPHTSVERPPS